MTPGYFWNEANVSEISQLEKAWANRERRQDRRAGIIATEISNLIGAFFSKNWKQRTWIDLFPEHKAWFEEIQRAKKEEAREEEERRIQALSPLQVRSIRYFKKAQEADRLKKLEAAKARIAATDGK